MAARSAEHVSFLKRPVPFAFCAAACFLPAAIAFFFLRFFFFFAFFFFFFFFFLALGFLAFFAFLAFFFFAAVFCAVRASVSLRIRRFVATVVSVATMGSSSNTIALCCRVCP